MSDISLFRKEIDRSFSMMTPMTQPPEAGIWDNFLPGAGKVSMEWGAKAARAASMGVGGVISAGEALGSGSWEKRDTTLSDKWFKGHDEILGDAVDYWRPQPNEVGVAGQLVGSLAAMIPLVIANPALAVAATQLGTAEDLVRKDVDLVKAQAVGAVQGLGLGLGIYMPILGKTLAQRVIVGGAGFNVVQGAVTRGASGVILEGTKAEEDYKAFDATALTLDVLLGMVFGGWAHLNPAARAQGAEMWNRIDAWTKGMKPSDVDAISVLRLAEFDNVNSLGGKVKTPADLGKHAEALETALRQLATDKPVNVDAVPKPDIVPDTARAEESVKLGEQIMNEAGVKADDLSGVPVRESGSPPGEAAARPEGSLPKAKPVVSEGDFDYTDPIQSEAVLSASLHPDTMVNMGTDAQGNPVYKSMRDVIEDARVEAEDAKRDAGLFEVAAACLLGVA